MDNPTSTSSTLTLSDGRALGFRELGEPDGRPLFFFHGTPGSRFGLAEDDLIAQLPGLRLIVPERPGYGLSDPKPGRTLLDWPDDVAELADHLGLESFAVAGASGGGPHALACAHGLASRVSLALLLASPSPGGFRGATRGMALGNRIGLLINKVAPWLVQRLVRSYTASFHKDPEGFVAAIGKQMAPPDRALLEDAALREAIVRDFQEAYRQGGEGHAADSVLTMTSRDWGFPLREISVPVFLWHGEEDVLVTRAMAEHLAREISGCEARFVPGAGHLLTEVPAVVEQLREVLSNAAGGEPPSQAGR